MANRAHSDSTLPPDSTPAARLECLVRANACIPYHENLPDKEHPAVSCSIYGAPETNELFVKLSSGSITFVEVTASPLSFPVMADRIFGMDVADHAAAFSLAEKLWETHRVALLKGSQPKS